MIVLKSKKTGNYIEAMPMLCGHLFVGLDGDPDGNKCIGPAEAIQRYWIVDACPKHLQQILEAGFRMEHER